MPPDALTHPLSIFLLKPDQATPEHALKGADHLTRHPLRMPGAQRCVLYVQPSITRTPRWVSFFHDVLTPQQLGVHAASSAAVLLLTRGTTTYALTFGHGRHLLAPGSFDERFGLLVTLNAVDPTQLRTIDKDTFEAIARHTREQVNRATSIDSFGLNIDQDLLRAVTGTPRDETLGNPLSGRDALHTSVKVTLTDLPAQLERYAHLARQTKYRKQFPWVDHINALRDPTRVEQLNDQLLAQLNSSSPAHIWLAPPEITDWPNLGFKYRDAKSARIYHDLRLQDYLAERHSEDNVTLEQLKRHHIIALDTDDTPHATWTAYRCLYVELQDVAHTYLLSSGSWYEIERDFVKRVNRDVQRIRACTVRLPACGHETEERYNKRVARQHGYALLDRKSLAHGGGRSKIEPCDLYTKQRQLIFVKHYSGSDALSHLFAQGRTSAETLLADPVFRTKFNQALPAGYRIARPRERLDPARYEIVYAIISRSAENATLPFFSRVNLRQAHRSLTGLGYRVSIAHIPRQEHP